MEMLEVRSVRLNYTLKYFDLIWISIVNINKFLIIAYVHLHVRVYRNVCPIIYILILGNDMQEIG